MRSAVHVERVNAERRICGAPCVRPVTVWRTRPGVTSAGGSTALARGVKGSTEAVEKPSKGRARWVHPVVANLQVARQKTAHRAPFWVCSLEAGVGFPTPSLPVALGGPSTKRKCVNIREEAQAWSA